jgi:ADP-ribose pyrophosphatase
MTTITLPEGTPASIAEALLAPHDLEEVVVAKHVSWKGQIFETGQLDVTTPDGKPGLRDLVWHHGGAGVLALRDGRMCLVRQWRVALNRLTLEIPAGKIDKGETDPVAAAVRELKEETGLTASEIIHLGDVNPSCAYSEEVIHIYLMRGLTKGEQALDDDEVIELMEMPFEEVYEMGVRGEIVDSKTLAALLMTKGRL